MLPGRSGGGQTQGVSGQTDTGDDQAVDIGVGGEA